MLKKLSHRSFLLAGFLFLLSGLLQMSSHALIAHMNLVTAILLFLAHFNFRNPRKSDLSQLEEDLILKDYIESRNINQAIRRCRNLSQCSLKEATDYVQERIS